jgi:hypothetical protein
VCDHPLGDLRETGHALDHQPGPGVPTKERLRDRLITRAAWHPAWALGCGDETWWTRLAQPSLRTWTDQPLRLVEQSVAKDDLDPKALACYGLLMRSAAEQPEEVWLRFVAGRPVSAVTTQFLAACCTRLAARGKAALVLSWDTASGQISKAVQSWIREHNRQVKQQGRGRARSAPAGR